MAGEPRADWRVRVRLSARDQVLADDTYAVDEDGSFARRIDLRDPGIDDARRALLWSPNSPTLIQAELTLLDGHAAQVDRVHSYTALRSVRVEGDRFLLNGRPIKLRLALENEEFVLHYQPKVDLESRGIVGLEALIRWQSPELGLVPPMKFIRSLHCRCARRRRSGCCCLRAPTRIVFTPGWARCS